MRGAIVSRMRLVTFMTKNRNAPLVHTGVVVDSYVAILSDDSVGLPNDMALLLAHFANDFDSVRRAVSLAPRRSPDEIELLAPVVAPPKFLGIGLNYRAHSIEMKMTPPSHQYWFNKQRTCVTGPTSPIIIPKVSNRVDYEGELGLVIATRAKEIKAKDWRSVVAGFIVVNDVSVRDYQAHAPSLTMGKSFDTHGPTGPYIVTADEIDDPHALRLRTYINDECRQDALTSDMVYSIPEMIEYLTSVFALEPGDILTTGSPSGVGQSFDPPKWLVPGDRVRIEIEGVGTLSNPVVAHTP